jgi:DNA-binding PadR family transcriptional regulator
MDAIEIPRARRDLVALTVLAILADRPRHPYEMQRVIREWRKDFAVGPPRRLYHAVDRLAREGLIEPVEVSREGKRPERTVYRLTDDGREEFASWLGELLTYPVPEPTLFEAAVSFVSGLPTDQVLEALRARAVLLEGQVAALETQLAGMQAHVPRVVLLETEYVQARRRAELGWLLGVIDDYASGRLPGRLPWDDQPPADAPPGAASPPERAVNEPPLRLVPWEKGSA